MNTRQAEINKWINRASTVYVRVMGTEFDVKITKAEARALNAHMLGQLRDSWVGAEECGDLYLEGML